MARPKNQTEKLPEESISEIPQTDVTPEDIPVIKQEEDVYTTPDTYTLSVLQSYPNYKELYVDKCGGAFTSDTAPHIRKNATLYKNPFFNPKITI